MLGRRVGCSTSPPHNHPSAPRTRPLPAAGGWSQPGPGRRKRPPPPRTPTAHDGGDDPAPVMLQVGSSRRDPGLRVCQPAPTLPGKSAGSRRYLTYPAGLTHSGGSRRAWSGGFAGVRYSCIRPIPCSYNLTVRHRLIPPSPPGSSRAVPAGVRWGLSPRLGRKQAGPSKCVAMPYSSSIVPS